MNALWYLYKRTIINKIKKALKRPITYFAIIFIIVYVLAMIGGISSMLSGLNFNNPQGLVLIMTITVLISFPANLLTYGKKKGLLFKVSDVHFIFSSPIHSKTVLIYTYLKTIPLSIILSLILFIVGIVLFHINPLVMMGYFIVSYLVCKVLEASIMTVLFGNEQISRKTMKIIRNVIKVISFLPVILAIYLLITSEINMEIINLFVEHPLLQTIPFIGWNIAIIRMLILGPTMLNSTCSVLYVVTAVIIFLFAKNMKCTGEYYEDAMTFAENYDVALKRSKKGEMVIVGKKKKYKIANIIYKGTGAKAIFYRQILEYKKSKYFIFGFTSLLNLAIGIIISVVYLKNEKEFGKFIPFIVPGACAYITLILSGYSAKWTKELENAYTYLVPDSTFRKLWYSTLVEHFRSIVDGILISLPAGIAMKLPVVQIILAILIYVCLQGNKLYIQVLGEALLGNTLGAIGKQFFRMTLQGIVIGIAVIIAAIGTILISVEVGYLLLILYSVIITGLIFILASTIFNRMEKYD